MGLSEAGKELWGDLAEGAPEQALVLVRGGEVGIAFGHVCSIGEVGAWLAPDERFVSRMGARTPMRFGWV